MVCLILISLVLGISARGPQHPRPDSTAEEVILRGAREILGRNFNTDTYRFEMSPGWIPASVLRTDPEYIESVQPVGAVDKYTSFDVIFRDPGGRRQKAQVQLVVDAEQKLPVARRRLMSGTVIRPEDIRLQWISVDPGQNRWVDDPGMLAGKTLRRTLLPGQPVSRNQISTEYIIKAGDSVEVLFEEQGIKISLRGEARQHGAKGDEIRIYSNETRRKYLGRVIGPGVVKWKKTLY